MKQKWASNKTKNFIKECDGSKDDAYQKMKELLYMDEKADAVICGDNILSFGAMKAIQRSKLKHTKGYRTSKFDDYPLADLVEPSITSVDIDVFGLGINVANILFEVINDSTIRKQNLISTSIKQRESTLR